MGERLKIHWDYTGVHKDALLPPLIYQPLLENSIYHGIEPSADGGEIWIEIFQEDDAIHTHIINTLPAGGEKATRKGNQIAMDNINQRLLAVFEGQAKMSYKEVDNKFQVHLTFPYVNDFSLC